AGRRLAPARRLPRALRRRRPPPRAPGARAGRQLARRRADVLQHVSLAPVAERPQRLLAAAHGPHDAARESPPRPRRARAAPAADRGTLGSRPLIPSLASAADRRRALRRL